MDWIEWVLLKLYGWRDVMMFFLVPLFLATLGAAIYLTWKAGQDRLAGK